MPSKTAVFSRGREARANGRARADRMPFLAVFLAGALAGCGGATAEQRTSYAVEQARCLANERAIVDRAGTSYDEDRRDLAAERERCDAALRAIYPGGE